VTEGEVSASPDERGGMGKRGRQAMRNLFSQYNKGKLVEQIATTFLCVSALFFLVIFGAISLNQFFMGKANYISQITESEAKFVERELIRRAADDCTLTRAEYGWRCEEIKTGKIFKVADK